MWAHSITLVARAVVKGLNDVTPLSEDQQYGMIFQMILN